MGEIARSIAQNRGVVLAGMGMVIMTTVSFYMITAYTPTDEQERHDQAADQERHAPAPRVMSKPPP